MPIFKNEDTKTWYVMARYTDWKGERKQKCKRGFATRKEALEWEREFLQQKQADVEMPFDSFVELYTKDIKPRLKENTWLTKESIIQKKILPYFGKRKLCEITAKDVIDWQNEIRSTKDAKGNLHSATYLKTIHNQLSAIFNHAVRYYDLRLNPAAKAGNMGMEERKEMLFWTKAEYQQFSDAMMDKPMSYYAFQVLYWCGIRVGELLALEPSDFDFERGILSISKSYQRLKCNSDSLYKMGNPYGWRQAHTLQFQLVYDYKDLFIPAFEESEFTFVTTYGAQSVLREITRNITEVYNYVMSDKEQFELQYFNYGCSYMFSKWAQNGMTQSPEEMADYFGRLVPPFLKNLIGE